MALEESYVWLTMRSRLGYAGLKDAFLLLL